MSASLAERVEGLIRAGDPTGVVAALTGASTEQRRPVVPVVRRLASDFTWWTAHNRSHEANALLVAGAGCLPTAKQVATWLCRSGFRDVQPRAELVVDVLRDRGVPWLGDLATLVAATPDRDPSRNRWRLTSAIVHAAGIAVPTTDEFVLGWLSARFGWGARRRGTVREELRADPFLAPLTPCLFEIDGVGALLDVTSWERSRRGVPAGQRGRPGAGRALR